MHGPVNVKLLKHTWKMAWRSARVLKFSSEHNQRPHSCLVCSVAITVQTISHCHIHHIHSKNIHGAIFEAGTVVSLKVQVFCDFPPRCLASSSRRFARIVMPSPSQSSGSEELTQKTKRLHSFESKGNTQWHRETFQNTWIFRNIHHSQTHTTLFPLCVEHTCDRMTYT